MSIYAVRQKLEKLVAFRLLLTYNKLTCWVKIYKEGAALKILFDPKVSILQDHHKLRKKHGDELAKQIQKRLVHLEAYENVSEVFKGTGHPEALKGNFQGYISLRLNANVRLMLIPILPPNYGTHEFMAANEIEIKGVIDYHGESKNKWIIP